MASNLVKKLPKGVTGFVVHDHSLESATRFKKEHSNVIIAKSPLEVAQQCSTIVTMLPASAHVRSVYLGENGLFDGLKKGSLLIDSSTIDPSTAKEVSSRLALEKGVDMLDCPVSGGTPAATGIW
jgi:3-hydroxyisobutyrate dehydrogenase